MVPLKHILQAAGWSLLIVSSPPAFAADGVLTGTFDGSEPSTQALPGGCGSAVPLRYRQVGFQVSASGTYSLADVFNVFVVDVTALVYENSFNPSNPQQNLETPSGIDTSGSVSLSSGTSYVLVVQHWCSEREGAWAVAFSGPGSVNSAAAADLPEFTTGSFSMSDPTANTDCGNSQYHTFGPFQVSEPGNYFYSDISRNHAVDVCVQIYSAPFSPSNPGANRVSLDMDDFDVVALQANRNYYVVAQPWGSADNGEYFFVLAPPAPFRLNPGMAGSWYNPATSGQGFFMDVFDNINQVFLAWFTYDLTRPDGSVTADIGDPGHRWLTAFGPFSGAGAELDIEWTVGGVFDAASPAPDQSVDGTISIEFNNCLSGTITYDLGSSGASGVVPIQRIANDSLSLCQNLTAGPGMPGPL